MEALTVPQLKDLCRKHALKVGGRKADIIARLKDAGVTVACGKRGSDAHQQPTSAAPSPSKKVKPSPHNNDAHGHKPPPSTDPSDPLALKPLFVGGGEEWGRLLIPTLQAQPAASTFIGPHRARSIVPVRELTFQALKPHPPAAWRVVVFGQNPYPRIESATGIAMLDATFDSWDSPRFGSVTSMRCIMKCAFMSQCGVAKQTTTAEMRKMARKQKLLPPAEWFQAMLMQGVLLLNAALTASTDGTVTTTQHTKFWTPIVHQIVREILRAKQDAGPGAPGLVFGWWGTKAAKLRKQVEQIQLEFPGVRVCHLVHANPAAMGDAFCNGDPPHMTAINEALTSVDQPVVDWLPSKQWLDAQKASPSDGAAASPHGGNAGEDNMASRMGQFIADTRRMHREFMDRMAGVADETMAVLEPIEGILQQERVAFATAVAPLCAISAGLHHHTSRALAMAHKLVDSAATLSLDEIAAVYLYTTESGFYKKLNAVLREPDRRCVLPYYAYLALLLDALHKLMRHTVTLWRGVGLDLRHQYPQGGCVTWWGVSSCTSDRQVARGFLGGGSGVKMLFEVHARDAFSIRSYSAFQEEEEFLLRPGTQFKVVRVTRESGNVHLVQLRQLISDPLVQ